MPAQVVTSADVFGIYTESVQQHLDDAFANKAHPDASPQFPQANAGPFVNSALAPPQPAAQQAAAQPPSSQPYPQPQPQAASDSSEDVASLATASPEVQDPAGPAVAAAPAAEHTASELPEGPAQDAAAATAANGMPTAIVPTDNHVVVEAVAASAAINTKPDTHKGNTSLSKGVLWFPSTACCMAAGIATGMQALKHDCCKLLSTTPRAS